MIKIAFLGPESSGKTTLAEMLTKKLNCSLVSEYARKYLENKPYYSVHDLKKIAEGQSRESVSYTHLTLPTICSV